MLRIDAVATTDLALVDALVEFVNRAYAVAEAGLFNGDAPRTDPADIHVAVHARELVAAWDGDRLVGAVRSRMLDPHTGWFGALAVSPERDGQGIGRALVAHVETLAMAAGAVEMQIELLAASPPLPHLERLAGWYTRLGYREVERQPLATFDAASSAQLTRPCDVVTCRKPLLVG